LDQERLQSIDLLLSFIIVCIKNQILLILYGLQTAWTVELLHLIASWWC